MSAQAPHLFAHTTLDKYPDKIVGVTLLDEKPGFTGIYVRDAKGGLWPARTVDRSLPKHHESVCNSWLSRDGAEDKRTLK